jgi:8-oxo-dGTP diphosphatase
MADLPQVTRVAAYGVCLDVERRLLLCRLGPEEPNPGFWTLPGGGLNFGEPPAEAALRELAEETGLTGEIVSLAAVESWSREGFQAIQIIYRVNLTGGELRDETDGSTDAAAWFGPKELATLPVVPLVTIALGLIG